MRTPFKKPLLDSPKELPKKTITWRLGKKTVPTKAQLIDLLISRIIPSNALRIAILQIAARQKTGWHMAMMMKELSRIGHRPSQKLLERELKRLENRRITKRTRRKKIGRHLVVRYKLDTSFPKATKG